MRKFSCCALKLPHKLAISTHILDFFWHELAFCAQKLTFCLHKLIFLWTEIRILVIGINDTKILVCAHKKCLFVSTKYYLVCKKHKKLILYAQNSKKKKK